MAKNRINITLPAETIKQLDELTTKGERSRFIHQAIQVYIAQIKTEKLRQQLMQGAIYRAERDLNLADDWFGLEEESWQKNTK